MTKEQIQDRITAKEAEAKQILQADAEADQQRRQQFAANQRRVHQIEGAIEELKSLLPPV